MSESNLHKGKMGVATLEILIAFAVITLTMGAVILIVFGNQSVAVDTTTNNEAILKAEGLLEDARALSRQNFNAVQSITPYADGIYTKKLDVGTIDTFTKQATSTVSWQAEGGRTETIKLSTLLSAFSGAQTVNNFHNANCWFSPPPSVGSDLGGTGYTAVNFVGSNGVNATKACLNPYDGNPNTFGSITLSADILVHGFNNEKGAGLFALYPEGISSNNGLMLVVGDQGITDRLRLFLVDGVGNVNPSDLKTTQISSSNEFGLDKWYRLTMQVSVNTNTGVITVVGSVYNHSTPANPNSSVTSQVGSSLNYSGIPSGVNSSGKVGVAGWSHGNSDLSTSVTNFIVTSQ